MLRGTLTILFTIQSFFTYIIRIIFIKIVNGNNLKYNYQNYIISNNSCY